MLTNEEREEIHTSFDYTQTLDDHGVLASIGSVGDAFDNASAESFVDSFKTELIRDRGRTARSTSSIRTRKREH